MTKRRKEVVMQVTVTVPAWCTAAQARREVRAMLNSSNNWELSGPDFQEGRLRAVKVAPGK